MTYECLDCGKRFGTSSKAIQCPECGSCYADLVETDFERRLEGRLKEKQNEDFEKFVSEAWCRLLQFVADEPPIESESEGELMERWLRWNREH